MQSFFQAQTKITPTSYKKVFSTHNLGAINIINSVWKWDCLPSTC